MLKAFWQTYDVRFTKTSRRFPTGACHLSSHGILTRFTIKDVDSLLRSRPPVQKATDYPITVMPLSHHGYNLLGR